MRIALLFPGQGSQTPDFLRRLPLVPAVREVFERSSEILGYDVRTLDSEAAVRSTVPTQMGLLIAGVAFSSFLSQEGVEPYAVAGMSVGTFAAAVACGAVDLEQALKLVKRRAELMQAKFEGCGEGMSAVQGLDLAQLRSLLQDSGLSIANYNSRTQFVVAGPLRLLESFAVRAIEAGAHKATVLATSVSSHTPKLAPATIELLHHATQLTVQVPNKVMFSNRLARPITTAQGVREELALNMASPVKWHDIMTAMDGIGINLLLESPPGHTLTALASENLPDVRALCAAEMRWDALLRAVRRTTA